MQVSKRPSINVHPTVLAGDYGHFLKERGMRFSEEGPYYRVGEPKQPAGWLLHVSVIRSQWPDLCKAILPILSAHKAAFKIVARERELRQLLNGDLGYELLGKLITVYPDSDAQAVLLAELMVTATLPLKGPAIPTDRHLGGAVYTRFGAMRPVWVTGSDGMPKKGYVNRAGRLTEDVYTIPYQPFKGAFWPFAKLAEAKPPKRPKFLKKRYGLFQILKSDAKGQVIKGVYLTKRGKLDWVLVKEGKAYMCQDDEGRDIADRLSWQHAVLTDLKGKVRVPGVVDFFDRVGCHYLIMEFIDGPSLHEVIEQTLHGRAWFSVERSEQLILLHHLTELLGQIGRLHAAGYVHRDITPGNVVVHQRKGEYLIDPEMTYSIKTGQPLPPFKFGTFGFMSPEQLAIEVPTVKEDIYGIGATLLVLFTGYSPLQFDPEKPDRIREQLLPLLRDMELATLIAACLSLQPDERPDLAVVEATLRSYRDRLQPVPGDEPLDKEQILNVSLQQVIRGAVHAFGSTRLLGPEQLWTSKTIQMKDSVGNDRMDSQVLPGWGRGIAGILYTLAAASKAGYDVSTTVKSCSKGLQFIQNGLSPAQVDQTPSGLFGGKAGIALSLTKGLAVGLVPVMLRQKTVYTRQIGELLSGEAEEIGLAAGLAGRGMAMLVCLTLPEGPKTEALLHRTADQLLARLTQNKFRVRADSGKKQGNGLAYGSAGIVLFLSAYYTKYPTPKVKEAIEKLLAGLPKTDSQKGFATWLYGKEPADWGLSTGRAGIALAYIRAYAALGNPAYRSTAEGLLRSFPPYLNMGDYTLGSGMAGIGEVMLEACEVFGAAAWQERVDWIALVLVNMAITEKGSVIRWQADTGFQSCADLMDGQAGILHFLLRYAHPDQVSPLFE